MLLTYRGLSYKRDSSESRKYKTTEFATYRGVTYRINRRVPSPLKQSRKNLKYRGISYFTD